MKKRINPAWRITIALLLLFALAPVVALSIPAQAGAPPDTYINNIPEYLGPLTHPVLIEGTAIADSPSTVNQVKVQITYEDAGSTYYWTGAAWYVTPTSLIALGAASLWTPQYDWSVALPLSGDLADGEEYTVTAWAEDAPGLVQDPTPATRSFTWDDELPGSSVIQTIGDAAAPGWTASAITAISGTAQDANSGVACVYVQIQRLTDGMYWDGVTWQPVPIYITATGTTSWSITTTTTPPLPNWTHSTSYNVEVYAVDKAGNLEAIPVSPAFAFDKTLTGIAGYIDTIPDYVQTTALPVITGAAQAGAGNVVQVDVKIQRQEDLYYWSDLGAAWGTYPSWNEAFSGHPTPSVGWSYPAPLLNDGVEYYIWARVTDGGAIPWESAAPTTFIADDTAPIGTQIYGSFIPGSTYLGPTVFDPMTASGVTGSSFDITGGSNPGMLDSVKLRILRLDTGLWWDGVAWQEPTGSYDFIDATGTTSWSITGATAPHFPLWEHMVYYSITAMGMDEAGNLETTAIANFVFIADFTGLAPPSVSVAIDCASAPEGGTADVDIIINTDDPDGIGSATITLTIDTAVVSVGNIAAGDLGTVYWNTVGSTTTMSAATGSSPGPTGTVTFATVTLNAVGSAGECSDLNIAVTSLYDATVGNPQPITPSPVTDCTFCIVDRLEGDVHPLGSGNDAIDSADFQLVAQSLVGTITLTGDDFLAADVNDSVTLDSADLQLVAQYLVGTITAFPGGTYIP